MSDTLRPVVALDPRAVAAVAADPTDAIPGALRVQALLGLEALCKLARRPAAALPSARHAARLDPRGDGRRFGLHKGSFSGVLVPMIVVSSLVDVPVSNLLLHAFAVPDEALLHVALIGATLWSLLWGVGLRSAVRHVDHVLHADALVLAIGFGAVCRLPLAAVKDVHVLSSRHAGWREERGLARRDVATLTPLDEPTLLIELLAARPGCRLVRKGRERPVPSWIAVYVDEPAALQGAVRAAQASAGRAPEPRS